MYLSNLKILSVTNPVGVAEKPYFSYVLESNRENVFQVSHEITVRTEEKIIWQLTENTRKCSFIPYDGILTGKTRYEVLVKATDNYGESGSICGFFETAFLEDDKWEAKWMESPLPDFPAEKGFGKQPPATLFRKNFSCSGEIKKARLYATCHGIYRPMMNGIRIGDGEFAPEHSTYGKVLFYQTYDVTELLCRGENVISFYVGDGWYLGVKTTPRIDDYNRKHGILFQLEIEYANGEKQTISSDENVECAYGQVICSDLFAGEKFDANKHPDNWQKAVTAEYVMNNLTAQYDPFVSCVEEISVKEFITTPKGEKVLDFGKVLAGRVRMKVEETKGTHIILTHSEVLDKEGNFFQSAEMPDGGVEQRDEYICDGEEGEYEPFFTFHGFRYVKVEGLAHLKPDNFIARVYSSKKDNLGAFHCSDERLNRLYENIRNSQRSNMLSIPTDCPQREKAGWTGDIGIYAGTALLNEDVTAFLNRWLKSLRADQGENGAVPIVVPYDGGYPMTEMFFGEMYEEKGTFGAAGWGDACILVPWAIYKQTGNLQALRENLDTMEKWCEYILKRSALPGGNKDIPYEYDRYLFNHGYQQGDWLVPSMAKQPVADPIFDTLKQQEYTAAYAAPMYAYQSFKLLSEIEKILGNGTKQEYYFDISEKIKEAIQRGLFDKAGKLPTDLMGAYVLAVALDLVPVELEENVAERLVQLLKENDYRLDTGFLSTPFLLDAFDKIGRTDLAYRILFQNKAPGWLYEVEHGATGIWESWESYDEDGNPKKISFNHYAFGCVDEWVFKNICGIILPKEFVGREDAALPCIKIEPRPECGLTSAYRLYKSIYGDIEVSWSVVKNELMLNCRIPCGTEAEIHLPGGKIVRKGSGSYSLREVLP